jgi:uncharacterized protein YfkK (UPF0435 family)
MFHEDPDRAFLITELQQKINEVVENFLHNAEKFQNERYEGLKNEEIAKHLIFHPFG